MATGPKTYLQDFTPKMPTMQKGGIYIEIMARAGKTRETQMIKMKKRSGAKNVKVFGIYVELVPILNSGRRRQ